MDESAEWAVCLTIEETKESMALALPGSVADTRTRLRFWYYREKFFRPFSVIRKSDVIDMLRIVEEVETV